jgi:parvulin-like peptidyl-prolyl isomerase
VRETPRRRASAPPSFAAPAALLALLALPLTGCPASPAPPPADSATPAPSAPPPLDGPRATADPTPSAAAPAPDAPPTIVGAAHILVAYKGSLGAAKTVTRTKADAKKRADEAHEKLVAHQGTFEELVAKYSDDDLSKPAGGKIGNFERNVFPPAFTDAAFGLAIGGVSEVVETPRGFHIITRTK